MGKSLDLVKQRIATGECNGIENAEWKHLYEVPLENIWKNMLFYTPNDLDKPPFSIPLPFDFSIYIDNDETKKINIIIQYDPEAEFQYFSTEQCICDSTLLFEIQNMENILNKIIHLETYYSPTLPNDFEEEPWKYDLIYTVGDFVTGMEIDDKFAPKDKPWMACRYTAMLPIKMEFVRKENE